MKLNELVSIQSGAAAIVFKEGLNQKDLVGSFVPTHSSLSVLKQIYKAAQYGAEQQDRAINCHGIYGSGKSRLAVLIGQMLRDGFDGNDFGTFLNRLKSINEGPFAEKLKSTFLPIDDEDSRPYLVVPIYGSSGATLQGALVENLYKAINEHPELDASNILMKTEYMVAASRLKEILEQDPNLRQAYLPSLDLGNQYHDSESLLQGLDNHEASALSVFSEWHRKITLGIPFRPRDHGAGHAQDIYLQAAKKLSEINYKGIAVIWDEFGYALESLLDDNNRSPKGEVFELQNFVEKVCTPSTGQVLFIGLTHVSISEYGPRANVDDDLKNRLETIQGRFSSIKIELLPAESEGYHLLSAQLVSSELGLTLKKQSEQNASRIFDVCQNISLFGHIGPELKEIIDGCYPLHPLTAAALLALSSRYAAATRTAFNFFEEMDKKKLFDIEIDASRLFTSELVRLPMLVDFYEEAMHKSGLSDQLRNFKNAFSQLNTPGDDKQIVNERENVLSIIMLSSLLDSNFQSSDEFLSIALHDAEYTSQESEILRSSLSWLSQAGLIWKNETTKLWSIGGGGGTDFETLIADAVQQIPEYSFADYINKFDEIATDLLPILGKHYLDPSPKGIVRAYSVETLSVVPQGTPKLEKYLAAKVLLVLSNTPEEASHFEQTVLSLPEDNIYYWFCFDGLKKLQSEFRLLLALIKLISQIHADEVLIRLNAKYDSVRSQLLKTLGELYGRVGLARGVTKVVRQGSTSEISVTSWHDFGIKLKEKIGSEYSEELQVRASQKKRNVLGDESQVDSAETIEIVERILGFESNPTYQTDLLGYPETSESASVVDATLGVSEIFIERPNGSWGMKTHNELQEPTKSVFELIKRELTRIRPTPYRLTDLASTLSAKPYGIPTSAMPIYVAAAIYQDIDRITWVRGVVSPAKNLCKGLVDSDIGLRVSDFTQYLLNVAEVLLDALKKIYQDPNAVYISDKHAKARKSVELLRSHLEAIAETTINSPNLNKSLREIYEIFKAIGKTPHELLEKVAEHIDPDRSLSGVEVATELKIKMRDDLVFILNSYQQIEDEKKYQAIQLVQQLLPGLEDDGSNSPYVDILLGSGDLGTELADLIKNTDSSKNIYDKILLKVLGKPISDSNQLELGLSIGKLQYLLENEKIGQESEIDPAALDKLSNTILSFANKSSLPLERLPLYLKAVIKSLQRSSEVEELDE